MIALDTGNNEVVKQSTLLASLLRKRLIPCSQVYSNGSLSKAVKEVVEQNWLYAKDQKQKKNLFRQRGYLRSLLYDLT